MCKEYWAAAQEIKSLDKKMRITKSKAFLLLLYAIVSTHKNGGNPKKETQMQMKTLVFWGSAYTSGENAMLMIHGYVCECVFWRRGRGGDNRTVSV